ncbi:MAG TPA: DNA methyltransferase [Acetobacteraceae bacterium]|nr:DNA methyltransferase [Acetobacteraceae bacterium]
MSAAATATRRVKTGGRVRGVPNKPKAAPSGAQTPYGDSLVKLRPYKLTRVADLVPDPRNPMQHAPDQVNLLEKLVREFKWTDPVLMDENRGILAGHGRVMAAKQMGLIEVPTLTIAGLSDAQKLAYIMADNESARRSTWDQDLLRLGFLELGELGGIDMEMTGFALPEIGRLLGPDAGNTDPDDAPAVQAVAVSRLGDVWIMGRHRLYAADCRDVLPTLAGVDACVTDPPYGIGDLMHGGTWGAAKKYADFRAWDVAPSDETMAALFAFPKAIVWGGNYFRVPSSRCWLVWEKTNSIETGADCELAWTNFDRPAKSFSFGHGVHTTGHPTQKPVQLVSWCLEFTPDAKTILDPYAGSGTTIIACEQTGRACVAIEVAPQYTDVAIRRWQSFSGGTAIHEPTGRPFAAIAAERAPA